MRVLIAGNFPEDWSLGSPRLLLSVGQAMREHGIEVDFLFSPGAYQTRWKHRASELLFPFRVARQVKAGQYDVADLCGNVGWVAARLRRNGRGPVSPLLIARTMELENMVWDKLKALAQQGLENPPSIRYALWARCVMNPTVAAAVKRSHGLISLTEESANYARDRKWVDRDRIAVIPGGISELFLNAGERRVRCADWTKEGVPRLLFVGTWIEKKGVRTLVSAFQSLTRESPDFRLTIAGTHADPETVLAAFGPETRAKVRVLPEFQPQELSEIYAQHDILLFPSLYEGFGLVFLEAMACGMVVIATPVGGVPTVVEPRQNGFIVPVADAESMVKQVLMLAAQPSSIPQIGQSAFETAKNFSWANIANVTLDFYNRLACQRR